MYLSFEVDWTKNSCQIHDSMKFLRIYNSIDLSLFSVRCGLKCDCFDDAFDPTLTCIAWIQTQIQFKFGLFRNCTNEKTYHIRLVLHSLVKQHQNSVAWKGMIENIVFCCWILMIYRKVLPTIYRSIISSCWFWIFRILFKFIENFWFI